MNDTPHAGSLPPKDSLEETRSPDGESPPVTAAWAGTVQQLPRPTDQPGLPPTLSAAQLTGRDRGPTVRAPDRVTTPAGPIEPEPIPVDVPGYEILSLLGAGGMGVVYKAWQTSLKRVVALKMIRDRGRAGESGLTRFRAEAEALARLQHPNIVQVYEVGEYDGQPYFTLEFVDGGSLDKRLGGEPQPARPAAELVETLARAMAAAHERGIVHRDLKPANVLLAPNPKSETRTSKQSPRTKEENSKPTGAAVSDLGISGLGIVSDFGFRISDFTPKITDFGLAKRLEDDTGQTRSGAVMGTPQYMAPEQAAGHARDVGPACDVYALGTILYELLTGRPPFRGSSMLDTLEQVRSQDPVPPSRLQPKLPRDLETICLKCLQKDPLRRYPSAQALADDLRRFVDGQPIHARPTPTWERLVKWAGRHPAAALLVASVPLAAIVLCGLALYHERDVRRERDEARAEESRTRDEAARDQLRAEASVLVAWSETALAKAAPDEWARAESLLTHALDRFGDDAALEDTRTFLGQALVRVRARLAEDNSRRRGQEMYTRFQARREDALFAACQSTGLNHADSWRATRAAAREALAIVGMERAHRPMLNGVTLSDAQRRDITDGAYELLLILARALVEVSDDDPRRQAQEGIRLLQCADLLHGGETAAILLGRASCFARMGNLTAAEATRRRAEALLEGENDSAADAFLVGYELYQRGRLPEAIRQFERVLGKQPGRFWAHYLLAVCHLKARPPEAGLAKARLAACAALRPHFPWTYLLKGFAHTELDEFAAAEDAFRQAAASAELGEDGRYVLLVNRGLLRRRQGKPAEAAACFEEATRVKPREILAFVNLAKVYQEQKRYDDAVRELDRATALQPGLAFLYTNRAHLFVERKDLERARADFEKAIRIVAESLPPGRKVPESREDRQALAEAHTWRGRLLAEGRHVNEALRDYDTALEIEPAFPAALRERALILLELKRYPEAAAAFDRYLRTWQPGGQTAVEVYEGRARVRTELREYVAAFEDVNRALELKPDSARFALRGWFYVVNNAAGLAVKDFDRAIQLDPANGDAYNGRGFARAALGQTRQAVEDAEEAVRRGPAEARTFYNAARTYAQAAGQATRAPAASARARYQYRAVELLRAALRLTPADERVRFWRETAEKDSALAPLRRSTPFIELAKEYPLR